MMLVSCDVTMQTKSPYLPHVNHTEFTGSSPNREAYIGRTVNLSSSLSGQRKLQRSVNHYLNFTDGATLKVICQTLCRNASRNVTQAIRRMCLLLLLLLDYLYITTVIIIIRKIHLITFYFPNNAQYIFKNTIIMYYGHESTPPKI